jgi:hypothetical protein
VRSIFRPKDFAIVLMLLHAAPCVSADALKYVTDKELKAEIAERGADLKRTQLRLAALTEKEQAASFELRAARKAIVEIEAQTATRVRAFYRMSRNAGTLKLLLDADSPTAAIRRITTLKRLLFDALEARRRAGLRIAEAQKLLSRIREDKISAGLMLDMLQEAYDARLEEASARKKIRPGR